MKTSEEIILLHVKLSILKINFSFNVFVIFVFLS